MFRKRKAVKIGLDLGSSSIKIVKLEHSNKKFILQNFIFKDIPQPRSDISSLLKNTLQEFAVENSTLSISLSGQNVITRYISIPIMNRNELKYALKFEAQKYIPFSIEEVNLDGHILRQDQKTGKMLILVAAARKEFVNQNIKSIQNLGFKVKVVDIDSLVLVNTFNFNYSQDEFVKNNTIALLNIGASITNLSILEQGMPCLSRDIHIAGNNFTDRIADNLGLDFKTAEELKIKTTKDNLDKIKLSLETVLSQLAHEVRSSFDYYESQSIASVKRIYISGGGSLLTSLIENLNNLLGIEIINWDPLSNLEFREGLDLTKIKAKSPQLPVAIGLAMR